MDIAGSYLLPCTQQRAWEALNDPELLKASLKGCERLEKTSDTDFSGVVAARIGPVSARFSGTMKQTNVDAPNGCDMQFEGQGGVAGFAKGSARVTLTPEGSGTRLDYVADAQIGGKLAQMGARLVEGTARSMADDFFGKFAAALGGEAASIGSIADAPVEEAAAPSGSRWLVYAGLAVLAIALAWYLAN